MAPKIRSIQGEQSQRQVEKAPPQWAEPEEVDKYVDSASPEVLACRERVRHPFPTLSELRGEPIDFIGVTDEKLLVRQVDCPCCGKAYRQELYEIVGRGRNISVRHVSGVTRYRRGEDGEQYLLPAGHGRVRPGDLRNSVATKAMQGQTAAQIRKRARERAAEIEAERQVAARRAAVHSVSPARTA